MDYTQYDRKDLDLREELARDRTKLANERTALSFIRTAIMLGVSGVTVLKLFADTTWAIPAGWTLIALAVTHVVLGNLRYFTTRRSLRRLSGHRD